MAIQPRPYSASALITWFNLIFEGTVCRNHSTNLAGYAEQNTVGTSSEPQDTSSYNQAVLRLQTHVQQQIDTRSKLEITVPRELSLSALAANRLFGFVSAAGTPSEYYRDNLSGKLLIISTKTDCPVYE